MFDPIFGLGGRAVVTHAILDCHAAALVPAKRHVNQAVVVADEAVNDGKIFLLDDAGFPEFAEFTGNFRILGNDNNAAGFAVKAIDKMRRDCAS